MADVRAIVFDFDGVFTDNKVYVDAHGNETVCCDRRDGLGIDLLRKQFSQHQDVEIFILSTETNPVVLARAKKMKIHCYHGIRNKIAFLREHFSHDPDIFSGLVYLGNDLNDLSVMEHAAYSIAPADAHPLVKANASQVLPELGGCGFVRAFVETLLNINDYKLGEINEYIFNS